MRESGVDDSDHAGDDEERCEDEDRRLHTEFFVEEQGEVLFQGRSLMNRTICL